MNNPLLKIKSINWKPFWKKAEPWAKALVLAIPVIIIIYLGVNIYESWKYTAEYSVDFKRANFKNQDLRFYIDEASTTPKILSTGLVNGVEYAEVGGTPLNFVFRPKEFPLGKELTLVGYLKGEGDWLVSVICNECDKSRKYDWQPLYHGFLNNYNVAAQFGTTTVYAIDKKEFKSSNNIENWLQANIATGTSLRILDKVFPQSKFANQVADFHEGSSTEIKQRLRGSHQFYVYLKNKLDLELIKKDLNMYDGTDVVNISLYDLDDNLLTQATIEDDGIAIKNADTFAPPINKRVEFDLPHEGIYRLAFEPVEKASNDWTINYFKINTNKLVLSGTNLILDPVILYTRTTEDKSLQFNVWHGNALQTIALKKNQEIKNLSITRKELGKNQLAEIAPGNWQISIKGDQLLSGANFALTEAGYFEPFTYDFSKLEKPSVVLANYAFEIDNTWTKVGYQIPKERMKELKDLKNIKLALRNRSLDKKFTTEQELRDQGLYPLAQFNDYLLWGRRNLTAYKSGADNLVGWLKDLLPTGATLRADESLYIAQSDFLSANPPAGFSTAVNELNFALRGNHEFYVYLDGTLNAEFVKEDLNNYTGKDEVEVKLLDQLGNIKCSQLILGDGNSTGNKVTSTVAAKLECKNLAKGVYTLKQYEKFQPEVGADKADFVIRKIKINSNKIVVKNKALNLDPITFFAANGKEKPIDLYYWWGGRDQKVTIGGDAKKVIELTKEMQSKHVKDNLPTGKISLQLEKGGVQLSGSNFAFKSDNWFDPEVIGLRDDADVEFAILQDIYDRSNFIKNLILSVK